MNLQGDLFDPTPAECPALALHHAKTATALRRQAEACKARGWNGVARTFEAGAAEAESNAEAIAMLADFYALAGIRT